MTSALRSLLMRVGTILVYAYGAVVAPTLHHAFHRDDHIHVGDSIIYLDHEREADGRGEEHHDEADAADDEHHSAEHHHHHHPGDPEHGSASLWHFGAALNDHLDRTPVLPALCHLTWLRETTGELIPLPVSRTTIRLRGPPAELFA